MKPVLAWTLAFMSLVPSAFAQQAPWGRDRCSHLQPRSGLRGGPDVEYRLCYRSFQQQVAGCDSTRRSRTRRLECTLHRATPGAWSWILA